MSIPDDQLRQQLETLGVNASLVRESFVRSQGAGGQNVNKVSSCVMLYYPPLHLTVKMQEDRSQSSNRNAAWHLFLAKVIALKKARVAAVRDAREQKRRQKRQRPKWLKRELVKFKVKRTSTKNARRKPATEE